MRKYVGEQVGNYRVLRLLGEGGQASVYLGEHVYLKSQAALKVRHAVLTEEERTVFLQEAQTLVRLTHPHIVRVLDFAVEDGMPFLVMEYAPHGTLRQRHPKGTQLPLDLILPYIQQVASALQYTHDQGLIHRDVKPENMLLNSQDQMLLSDFGLVMHAPHLLSSEATEPMEPWLVGTMSYLAPEQLRGKAQPASDQYALGVVVYEWLCGKPPFRGPFLEVAVKHVSVPPPSLREQVPNLSPAIEEVVLRALAKEPEQRFASVAALAAALDQASQQVSSRAELLLADAPLPPAFAPSPHSALAALPSEACLATEAMPPTSQREEASHVEAPGRTPLAPSPASSAKGGQAGFPARSLPMGTVTMLFTDIEGSTRLLQQLGNRYAVVLAECRHLLRTAFQQWGGHEVDTQGDAFFVAFARATDAALAAIDAQRALATYPWSEGVAVRVRMGLHTGEPQLSPEGYTGLDVHRAARIMSAAHGGQVVLSERTRALLTADLTLTDLGTHRLKDFDRPEKFFQLGDERFPPLRSLGVTNLPAQITPLIGRQEELREVRSLVCDHRLVTVTGAGGIGKTTLVLGAAAELTDQFNAGVFWVALAAIRDPELVVPAIELTLGAKVPLPEHVDEKRMLLLLDNLEQVVEVAPVLGKLLARCPNLHLLVTSRALLRLRGEREYPVRPLPNEDAVELFRARAAEAEPQVVVAEICRRLDGLPLAIELAAARTRLLPPLELLRRLEQRLPLLVGGARDAPERQRTVRATIEWSHDLLSPDEQALFAQLAVFTGGFALEAAEKICEVNLDDLESLVEKSLVLRTGGRYSMLETIREYAVEKLHASDREDEIRRRHLSFFVTLAEGANLSAEAEGPQHHDMVIRDEDNVRAAIDWALSAGLKESGLQLAVALENFWVARNPLEGMRIFSGLLQAARDVSPVLRARALRAFGGSNEIAGEIDRAEHLYEESLALFCALGDELGAAILRFRLGTIAVDRGDTARALSLLEGSLEVFRKLGSRRGETQALGSLGSLARVEENTELAVNLFERSATMAAEIGRTWWEAGMCANLAELALEAGRPEEAATWARRTLALATVIGDRKLSVCALAYLACTAIAIGDSRGGGRLWGAVEAEEARGPLGTWRSERSNFEQRIMARWVPELEIGMREGRLLPLEAAVDEGLAASERVALSAQVSAGQPSTTTAKTPPTYPAGLTAREVEVLRLLGRGLSNAQIAEELVVSLLTVKAHLRSIYSKVGVTSRSAATRYALEHHLS